MRPMDPREETFGERVPLERRRWSFEDRLQAGVELGAALQRYRGRDTLVLGIPRGGAPVAQAVAEALGAELDVIVARKVGAPIQPELAMGAVTPDGTRFLNEELVRILRVAPDELELLVAAEREEAVRRERLFRPGLPPLAVKGRTVILVDDGLATGATMRAAIRAVRKGGPAKLVVAVPVAADETCDVVAEEVDELVCLARPSPFFAVGLHYRTFEPTSDEEVLRSLGRGSP